jgi:hypothetical protein
MRYMEIALLPHNGIKIKGKTASIAVDYPDKNVYQAVLLLVKTQKKESFLEDQLVLCGSGEYETGGVKITGISSQTDVIYSLVIDGITLLVGNLSAFVALQSKLQEHNVVLVSCDIVENASFLTTLGTNAVLFYGEKAGESIQSFGKENVKQSNKISYANKDKLPTEMETILLS